MRYQTEMRYGRPMKTTQPVKWVIWNNFSQVILVVMKKVDLEGRCYVVSLNDLDSTKKENWEEAAIINKANGAQFLSQYFFRIHKGISPIRSFPNSDVVLFVINGTGEIIISGKKFPIKKETGIYVKPNEAFAFDNKLDDPIELIAAVCPEASSSEWLTSMSNNFDERSKTRTAGIDESKKIATGDRFYQQLVGKEMGSSMVTQFIGSIPKSKAPEHFHLYEEAITILSGKGYMWAGSKKTPVGSGSVIFLPKKQVHCLECTVDGGLKIMGLFYPAGSPDVSYS